MTAQAEPPGSVRLRSRTGLGVEVNANGSIRRMEHGDVVLNLFPGTEMEGGPTNLHLRRHGTTVESTPLLGPRSPGLVHLDERGLVVRGDWRDVRFHLALVLADAAPAWFWHVWLENTGGVPATVDLLYAQDLALAPYGAIRMNEYYVSQYVDYTPLAHASHGHVLAVRQNLAVGGRIPWAVLGSLGRATGFATDALDLHGLATRAGLDAAALAAPDLPARRRQHEHSMAVLQDERVHLDPGATVARGFFGWFVADHPDVTTPADVVAVDRALALPEARPPGRAEPGAAGAAPAATLFSARPPLRSRDLDEAELTRFFGPERRALERDGTSALSFFAGTHGHVVTRAKELRVLRPHGHIVRTGDALVPDEASLTSTLWMAGVFHSLITQGHVGINRFLSTTRSYLGLFRALGQRVFVDTPDGFALLDVPSAFEMTPGSARWIYALADGVVEVRSRAATDRHELTLGLEVVSGAPRRFLVASHVALGGDDGTDPVPVRHARDGDAVVVRPPPDTDVGRRFPAGFFRITPRAGTRVERVGGDELLFADGRTRGQPFLTIVTAPGRTAAFAVTGGLVGTPPAPRTPAEDAADESREEAHWRVLGGDIALQPPAASPLAADVACLGEVLPWFAHDAAIHYLAPRGLEQFSGGGWGTRDVTQGPLEWLLALDRWEPMRDLLLWVFAAQNPDGDWPQWFTFFERDRGIRADDAHGDIVFWPLLALARYLLGAEDATLLDAVVPFFHPRPEQAEQATILAHVERALGVVARRTIPSTRLVAYGHGDWNDSLQPVDPAMRERLCSAWTVTLHVQTLSALAAALRGCGRTARAAELEAQVEPIRADFQRLLISGGTLAGFAHFQDDGAIEYLLHPTDRRTGIGYRLLPMIHAITGDLLTPEQARAHLGHIRAHLLGPDGARLFDRPPAYRGGRSQLFQRAESSTFFGREIGLMYTHAHLRWAEALARYGDADAFLHALRQACPILLGDVVPGAARRQANCYTSSSDAAFADRYEAQDRYPEIARGRVRFEGGWRVYSSGAGIALRLILECFLGLRRGRSVLTVDPVVPPRLDGLRADVPLGGRRVGVVYRTGAAGCGPVEVTLNGVGLPFAREANPYRDGAAVVPMAAVTAHLTAGANELVIRLA